MRKQDFPLKPRSGEVTEPNESLGFVRHLEITQSKLCVDLVDDLEGFSLFLADLLPPAASLVTDGDPVAPVPLA